MRAWHVQAERRRLLNTKTMTTQTRKQTRAQRKRPTRRRGVGKLAVIVGIIVGATVALLGIVFWLNTSHATTPGQAGQYPYQVGQPGVGAQAPAITLPSTNGNTFTLAAQRGKTVLLYFQEGIDCEPCWSQLKDIQGQQSAFQALGINEIVTITSDPLNALKQKVTDEGITLPVLSDSTLAISQTYSANNYGMMGASRDGHSFLVVGPTGTILWRADYGGAPNYTMYVPVPSLLADLRAGLGK